MTKKNVVLGVTGSIAAYKACDIVSRLRKQDVDVRVILTRAGAEIITPLALETISANPEGGNDLNICLLICHIYSTSD